MDIYKPRIITEEIISKFRPTRLAIKELAGQKYFCKSILEDIESYPGSGVRWKKRIKKYGKENIKTLWVSDWYYTPQEIQEAALQFSKENQIVKSELWANIKPENGLDGGSFKGFNGFAGKTQTEHQKAVVTELGKSRPATDRMRENAATLTKPGKENSRALKIEIYNSKNQLVNVAHGNFEKVCKDNGYPHGYLVKSYKQNGLPIMVKCSRKNETSEFNGWFAKIIDGKVYKKQNTTEVRTHTCPVCSTQFTKTELKTSTFNENKTCSKKCAGLLNPRNQFTKNQ